MTKTLALIHHGDKQCGPDPALTDAGIRGVFRLAASMQSFVPDLQEIRYGIEQRVKQTAELVEEFYSDAGSEGEPALLHDYNMQDGKGYDISSLPEDKDYVGLVMNSYHLANFAKCIQDVFEVFNRQDLFPEMIIIEADVDSWEELVEGTHEVRVRAVGLSIYDLEPYNYEKYTTITHFGSSSFEDSIFSPNFKPV
jgi:phosphohistidine phosphatase SixA